MTERNLVLASASPRRRELIQLGGWQVKVASADIDETPHVGENPAAYVERLARAKAQAIAAQQPSEVLVLAADTTVVDGDIILGKPADAAEAREISSTATM